MARTNLRVSLRARLAPTPGRRALAWVSLACQVVAAVLLVQLVIARPGYVLWILLVAACFLGAAYAALLGSGHRRAAATAAAVLLAVALVVSVLFWSPDPGEPGWQGPVSLLLFALGIGLARRVIVPPLPPSTVVIEAVGVRARGRPVLIVNPRSGDGRAEQVDLAGACADLGIETIVLGEGDELPEVARRAARDGADALGMAGGDGSLGCVAEVAVEHDLPFVCVPAGTRNHFALDLGLDRDDPRQALAAFVDREERRVDYGTVNGRLFLNNVSLGLYAAIVEQESYRDAKLETALTLLPELWDKGGPWFDLQFDVPGHGHLDRAAILQVSNNPYGREIGRRDRLDAGELGILTADPSRLAELVGLTMLTAAGLAERSRALWAWAASAFTVRSRERALSVGLDGETVSLETPLEFAVVPLGLRVLVPAGTRVGRDEQTGAKGTFAALLEVAFGLGGPDR